MAGETAALIEDCLRREAWGELSTHCHSLAGRAGMFGYGPLGEVARAVEEAIDARCDSVDVAVLTRDLLGRLRVLDSAQHG